MKIISLNIGKPNEITWKGKRSVSGIYKYPTEKKVFVSPTNIEGDGQGNLKVHGGIDKAIYVYPFEHYEYWKKSFPDIDFSEGIFGENLTTAGLDEFTVADFVKLYINRDDSELKEKALVNNAISDRWKEKFRK